MAGTEASHGLLDRVSTMVENLVKVTTTKAPIGQTPRQPIWTLNKATLYRYTPVKPAEERHRVPLLLIFALMNRSSILDLRPGNSFVEYMVNKGYDLYLLDWGVPGPEDAEETFNLLGWCIGAMLSTLYASLRGNVEGLKSLILLTAPLDFTDKEQISLARMTDERYFDVDRVLQAFGNMPAGLIDYGAKMLKPVENFVGGYMRLLDNLENPKVVESWHAMNTWVNDAIPLAGGAYRQFIVDFYRGNKLMNGTLTIRGERVDLRNLRANLLNVIAVDDHITPPCQSARLMEKVGSLDKQELKVPGGHIGVMAGSGASKGTWPKVESWIAARSD